jgi:hypothetical protein
MNDFVNPQHRGVNLPPGFKDLMDVIEAKGTPGTETPIYALHSNRASPVFERHVNGLSQVERFLNLLLNSKSKDSFLSVMLKNGRFFGLNLSGTVLKVSVAFGEGDLVLERTLREIFAEVRVIPVVQTYSPIKGTNFYGFDVPIDGTPLLEILTKALRAYGVSDTDELMFLLRA